MIQTIIYKIIYEKRLYIDKIIKDKTVHTISREEISANLISDSEIWHQQHAPLHSIIDSADFNNTIDQISDEEITHNIQLYFYKF